MTKYAYHICLVGFSETAGIDGSTETYASNKERLANALPKIAPQAKVTEFEIFKAPNEQAKDTTTQESTSTFGQRSWAPGSDIEPPEFGSILRRSSTLTSNNSVPISALAIMNDARSLLGHLMTLRDENCASETAGCFGTLVLVGYGLGGVIVKQALLLANKERKFHSIAIRTTDLIFFATPHRAQELSEWEAVLMKLIKASGYNIEGSYSSTESFSALVKLVYETSARFRYFHSGRFKITDILELQDTSIKNSKMIISDFVGTISDTNTSSLDKRSRVVIFTKKPFAALRHVDWDSDSDLALATGLQDCLGIFAVLGSDTASDRNSLDALSTNRKAYYEALNGIKISEDPIYDPLSWEILHTFKHESKIKLHFQATSTDDSEHTLSEAIRESLKVNYLDPYRKTFSTRISLTGASVMARSKQICAWEKEIRKHDLAKVVVIRAAAFGFTSLDSEETEASSTSSKRCALILRSVIHQILSQEPHLFFQISEDFALLYHNFYDKMWRLPFLWKLLKSVLACVRSTGVVVLFDGADQLFSKDHHSFGAEFFGPFERMLLSLDIGHLLFVSAETPGFEASWVDQAHVTAVELSVTGNSDTSSSTSTLVNSTSTCDSSSPTVARRKPSIFVRQTARRKMQRLSDIALQSLYVHVYSSAVQNETIEEADSALRSFLFNLHGFEPTTLDWNDGIRYGQVAREESFVRYYRSQVLLVSERAGAATVVDNIIGLVCLARRPLRIDELIIAVCISINACRDEFNRLQDISGKTSTKKTLSSEAPSIEAGAPDSTTAPSTSTGTNTTTSTGTNTTTSTGSSANLEKSSIQLLPSAVLPQLILNLIVGQLDNFVRLQKDLSIQVADWGSFRLSAQNKIRKEVSLIGTKPLEEREIAITCIRYLKQEYASHFTITDTTPSEVGLQNGYDNFLESIFQMLSRRHQKELELQLKTTMASSGRGKVELSFLDYASKHWFIHYKAALVSTTSSKDHEYNEILDREVSTLLANHQSRINWYENYKSTGAFQSTTSWPIIPSLNNYDPSPASDSRGLEAASMLGLTRIVKNLLNNRDSNSDENLIGSPSHHRALDWAVLNGYDEVAEFLISTKSRGNHGLFHMAGLNKAGLMSKYLSNEHERLVPSKILEAANWAANSGSSETMHLLLNADSTKTIFMSLNHEGWSDLLRSAVLGGNREVLELLWKRDECIKMFAANGVPCFAEDALNDGKTLLMVAAQLGHEEAVRFLTSQPECVGDLLARDRSQRSAIHYAIRRELSVMDILLEKCGASFPKPYKIDMRQLAGNSTSNLLLGYRYRYAESLKTLFSHRSILSSELLRPRENVRIDTTELDTTMTTDDAQLEPSVENIMFSFSPWQAVRFGDIELVKILERFADLHFGRYQPQQLQRDAYDSLTNLNEVRNCQLPPPTPLQIATSMGHNEVVRYILENYYITSSSSTLNNHPRRAQSPQRTHMLAERMKLESYNSDSDVRNSPPRIAASLGLVSTTALILSSDPSLTFKVFPNTGALLCHAADAGHYLISRYFLMVSGASLLRTTSLGFYDANTQTRLDPDKSNWSPLIHAVMNQHTDLIRLFIQHCSNVSNSTDHNSFKLAELVFTHDRHGRTALYLAAETGKVQVLELLLENKTFRDHINMRHGYLHQTALHAGSGNPAVTKLLLDHGAQARQKNRFNKTALDLSIANTKEDDPTALGLLLDHEDLKPIATTDSASRMRMGLLLQAAACKGFVKILTTLLDRFPELLHTSEEVELDHDRSHSDAEGSDAPPPEGGTGTSTDSERIINPEARSTGSVRNSTVPDLGAPVFKASVRHRQPTVLRELIRRGVSVAADPETGETELHRAVYLGFEDIVSVLINEGGYRERVDEEAGEGQETPLYIAAYTGKVDCARVILEAKANPNKYCGPGLSPLHVVPDNPELVELLISHGADLGARTKGKSRTVLMETSLSGFSKVVRYLLFECKVPPNEQDVNGKAALHYAVDCAEIDKAEKVIELLLDANADINLKDKSNRSPVDYAEIDGNERLLTPLQRAQNRTLDWLFDECISSIHYSKGDLPDRRAEAIRKCERFFKAADRQAFPEQLLHWRHSRFSDNTFWRGSFTATSHVPTSDTDYLMAEGKPKTHDAIINLVFSLTTVDQPDSSGSSQTTAVSSADKFHTFGLSGQVETIEHNNMLRPGAEFSYTLADSRSGNDAASAERLKAFGTVAEMANLEFAFNFLPNYNLPNDRAMIKCVGAFVPVNLQPGDDDGDAEAMVSKAEGSWEFAVPNFQSFFSDQKFVLTQYRRLETSLTTSTTDASQAPLSETESTTAEPEQP